MSNHAAKRPVKEALYESGMEFTVLQPTMFMQTLDNGWNRYGFPGGNALVLRAILGREPRTLRQYIQELASRKAPS